MRLLKLNDNDEVVLTEVFNDCRPSYAILSHTWGPDHEEVTFEDLTNRRGKSKVGYEKLRFCAEQAKKNGLQYCWVDTCCIDKANLSELSESIISMFRWYREADRCYVYLTDVSSGKRDNEGYGNFRRPWEPSFRSCRWFTRGWTLQELLAPSSVEFFSRERLFLGTKATLAELIQEITAVPIGVLRGSPLSDISVPNRMSWAKNRTTKKPEDLAYCLLGIFDVVMAPMYGERGNAMVRLKNKIAKRYRSQLDDIQSVLDSVPIVVEHKDSTAGKELLELLRFEQMDARRDTIKSAYSTTCAWLLTSEAYTDWLDPEKFGQNQGFLWLHGKPGAGKSTLVKFLHNQARASAKDGEVIVSYYFNARGDSLGKSTMGMYRSLLFQLLRLTEETEDLAMIRAEVSLKFQPFPVLWNLEVLRELLTFVVFRVKQQRPIKCFIDALDECDEQEVREMILHFEDLESMPGQLHVCLASRHYPTIHIRHGIRLVLEDEAGHSEGLAEYVQNHLHIGESLDDIKTQVQTKANGVFMWAVLVINILNEEYRRGRIFAVQKRLNEMPARLGDLFKDILHRDQVNTDDLLLCIQWILFAKRPLYREEFYHAMVAGITSDPVTIPWDPKLVTFEDMSRFIRDCSKGLAELTKSETPTVQFIHESVRDFLVKDGGLYELWPELEVDPAGLSHHRLSECCQRFLAINIAGHMPLEILPPAYSPKARRIQRDVWEKFPFLQYAVEHVFHHADKAANRLEEDNTFLLNIDLQNWISVTNVFQKFESHRHTYEAHLLYVLAEQNSARLIKRFYEMELPVPSYQNERYRCPLSAAMRDKNWDAFRALLAPCNDSRIDDVVQNLKTRPYAPAGTKTFNTLIWALLDGFEPLAEMLSTFDYYTCPNITSGEQTPLCLAAEKGYCKVICHLMYKGNIDVDEVARHDVSALYHASKNNHPEAVKLLLAGGAKVSTGMFKNASSRGYHEVVKLLLDAVKLDPGGYGEALRAACRHGHLEVVKTLLDGGTDIEFEHYRKGTALQSAAMGGHREVVKLLLDAGADVNMRTPLVENHSTIEGAYSCALYCASKQGHQDVVRQLIEAGADVNLPAGIYNSVLYTAWSIGHKGVVKLLLDAGAVTNSRKLKQRLLD